MSLFKVIKRSIMFFLFFNFSFIFSKKLITVLEILFFLDSCHIGLTLTQFIENNGYRSEIHNIRTEDGYILTYYRIPHKINKTELIKRPAILLQHGLMSSAADFINMGENRSLAFILSNAGYDVWLGNARGNGFSRNHTTLNVDTDKRQFFNFSFHEIGYYDNAAAIDYILKLKGDDDLYYVGHSQGTTIFFVLMSTRPEYNKKIKVAHLLTPSGYLANKPGVIDKIFARFIIQIERILLFLDIHEIPYIEVIRSSMEKICVDFNKTGVMCETVRKLVKFDQDKMELVKTHTPSNAAVKQFLHYGQLIKSGKFLWYDYGTAQNIVIYGKETPPKYNMSKVTAPVALYYSESDGVLAAEDIVALKNDLGNVVYNYSVPGNFNHNDFLFGRDVVNVLYSKLLEVNKRY